MQPPSFFTRHRNLKQWFSLVSFIYPVFREKRHLIGSNVAFSIPLIVLGVGLNVGVPILLKTVIGRFVGSVPTAPTHALTLFAAYGAAWTLSQVMGQCRQIFMFRATERASRKLSLKIMGHIFELPAEWHINKQSGALVGAIERAHSSIPNLIWGPMFYILPTLVEVGVVTALITYWYGIEFLVAMGSIASLFVAYSAFSIRWSIQAQRESNARSADANARVNEALLNFETIKYFNSETYELEQANINLKKRENAVTSKLIVAELVSMGQSLIVGGGLTLILCMTGVRVVAHQLAIGDFVLINSYMLQFVAPLGVLGYLFRSTNKAMVDMANIVDILQLPTTVQRGGEANRALSSAIEGDIRFENVSFAYSSSREILKNVSFTIPAHRITALIGPTGSGKSTVAKLLLRIYQPSAGVISLAGANIGLFDDKELRDQIAIVPQDIAVFSNTILYNISYGCPTASRARIEEAVEVAALSEFIDSLPDRYETQVGERGLRLSGGERQRLAIARAILRSPAIYVFDEATSALDAHTEKRVLERLKATTKTSTTLFITHRTSVLEMVDNTVMLDGGVAWQHFASDRHVQEQPLPAGSVV